MRVFCSALLATALALAGSAAPARAQSLADVARREAERRKGVKDDGKVLTNKDVPNVPQPSSPPPGDTTEPKPDATGQPADAAAAAADAAASATPPGAPAQVKDQKYWGGRLKDLQSQLEHDQIFVDALQSRINGLTTDFVNRDDPAQRAVIASDRQKAVDELARLNAAILADKKAIVDFEEEARRAGVPPGWLR